MRSEYTEQPPKDSHHFCPCEVQSAQGSAHSSLCTLSLKGGQDGHKEVPSKEDKMVTRKCLYLPYYPGGLVLHYQTGSDFITSVNMSCAYKRSRRHTFHNTVLHNPQKQARIGNHDRLPRRKWDCSWKRRIVLNFQTYNFRSFLGYLFITLKST